MASDQHWMSLAIGEARKGQGRTHPNPIVGSVITRNGELVAKGYHRKAGADHAEIDALKKLDGQAEDCCLYVNLEPCSHHNRTGPCTEAIIKSGIKRVVIGVQDPNPKVNGRGIALLEQAGIEVVSQVLEQESREMNAPFFTYIEKNRPFVSMKVAGSLDARIATRTGDSKWLSGKEALDWSHQLRDRVDAILVGTGTVLADDPSLNVRRVKGRDPLRVVLDSGLRTSLDSKLYSSALAEGTLVFTCSEDISRLKAFRDRGVEVEQVSQGNDGRVDLTDMLSILHDRGCLELLVEGGGVIHGAFMKARLVDRLYYVLTPWLIGSDGTPAFSMKGQDKLSQSLQFSSWKMEALGQDFLIEAFPDWSALADSNKS